jgi:hypothetical protein
MSGISKSEWLMILMTLIKLIIEALENDPEEAPI